MFSEKLDKILEEAGLLQFKTEEEAVKWLNEKLQKEFTREINYTYRGPKKQEPEHPRRKYDRYYQFLKRHEAPESLTTGSFFLSPKDFNEEMDYLENEIGRYPIGFRHYENYQNYRLKYPNANIDEYQNEMNRQVEYHEFKEIHKLHILHECKHNPNWIYKLNLNPSTIAGQDQKDQFNIEEFVYSDVFDQECRAQY